MSSRADNFTQQKNTEDLFSDFTADLSPHPITGDVVRLRNERAIRESLRNIIMTNYGEALFQPNKGSNVNRAIFEMDDEVTANDLKYHMESTIAAHEPRVQLLDVNVQSLPEENKLGVQVIYVIINTQALQSLNLILRRVR